MRPGRRRLRWALIAALGLLALVMALVAYAVLWPAPDGLDTLRCAPADGRGCTSATGRVVYVRGSDWDAHRPLHVVLVSKDSLTAPLLSALKVPVRLRPAEKPRLGQWMSAVGTEHKGSHGFPDMN